MLKAGTPDLFEDFKDIVEKFGSRVAIENNAAVLEAEIMNQITVGSTGAFYRKAVSCLKVQFCSLFYLLSLSMYAL